MASGQQETNQELRPHTRKKRRTPELGVRLGSFNPLAQASSRRTDWVADGFAGNEKFDSPVLLPAGSQPVDARPPDLIDRRVQVCWAGCSAGCGAAW